MQFLSSIKKNEVILVSLILFIILLIGALLILNYKSETKNQAVPVTNGLKNYAPLQEKIKDLSLDPSLSNEALYFRLVQRLQVMDDKTATSGAKYEALKLAANYAQELYAVTNNNKVYKLTKLINDVAKDNFPANYKSTEFPPSVCIDPSCADSPQPPEMLNVVKEIQASNIPDEVKKTFTQDVLNPGYVNKNDEKVKVFSYLVVARIFQNSGALTKAGLNEKLYQEITDYLQKTYPQEYQNFVNSPTTGPLK